MASHVTHIPRVSEVPGQAKATVGGFEPQEPCLRVSPASQGARKLASNHWHTAWYKSVTLIWRDSDQDHVSWNVNNLYYVCVYTGLVRLLYWNFQSVVLFNIVPWNPFSSCRSVCIFNYNVKKHSPWIGFTWAEMIPFCCMFLRLRIHPATANWILVNEMS